MKTFQRQNQKHLSDDVFIIGNGISRKDINLNDLQGTTVGCNLIYKEFIPTIIVSISKSVIEDIIKYESKILGLLVVPQVALSYISKPRRQILYKYNCVVDDLKISYITSGNFAVDYVLKYLQPKNLHLIGFDNDTTNMYYGYKNYKRDKGPNSTDWPKNLIQLNYILRKYKEII